MAFQMTAAEVAQYGNKLSIWQQIALLQAWAPLIGYAQRFAKESDPFKRGMVVAEACEWMASKTETTADDEFVRHLAAMLRTPEGEQWIRWMLLQVEALKR